MLEEVFQEYDETILNFLPRHVEALLELRTFGDSPGRPLMSLSSDFAHTSRHNTIHLHYCVMSSSLSAECNEVKERYDSCFLKWYSESV